MPAPLFRMFRPYASAGLEAGTQLKINGVNRTSIIHDQTQLSFTATMGQRGTCSVPLCLDADNSYDPQIGDYLEIFELDPSDDSSFRVWAGTTDTRQLTYIDDAGLTIADLTGVSLEQFYDTQMAPAQEFNATDAGAIATALFNSTANPFGITLGTVDSGVSINNRVFDGKTSIWSGIAQLATDSNVIAYIDPRDLKFYFHARDTRPAPWELTSGEIFTTGTFGTSFRYKQSRADFRDKQVIQTVPNTLPPSGVVFTGDGATLAFTLPGPATQVISATVTLSTQATATGTLATNLANGDTLTIGGQVYTAVTAIDNTVANQIFIGAANTDTATNCVAAINAGSGAGTLYSTPTQANISARALTPVGAAFDLQAVAIGAAGNAVAISETSSHFSWSGATLTGGVDGTVVSLSIGIAGMGSFGLTYSPGSTSITLETAPATGALLYITYVSAGGSLDSGNSAAIGLGITSQTIASTAHNVTQQVDVEQQAAAILSAFSILPGTFTVVVIRAGLFVGQLLTVNLTVPARAATLLNGDWLVQDIVANWVEGFEFTETPCFWYTVTCINSTQISPYQDTLARLADTGPVNNQQPTPGNTGDGFAPIAAPRTFLVKDSTVGTNIADIVPIVTPMTLGSPVVRATLVGQEIVAVLKVAIGSDLTVRINKTSQGSPVIVDTWTITIPSSAAPGYVSETYINEQFNHLDVLSADVIASDGQQVADGIASFTVVFG